MNKRKHELEQNELADALGSRLDQIKPHIPKIAMFSAVGILGIIAIAFWFNTRQSISESQWREYFVSSRFADSRGMMTVAEIFPDTTVGNFAYVYAGDADFANGSNTIVNNRDNYSNLLKQAAESYERVIESSQADDFTKLRATYALGYTYEGLGRFEKAKEMYESVVESAPDTPEGELAQKSLDRVNDPNLLAIYDEFRAWAPKTDETAPSGLGGGSFLPNRPDISMPTELEQAPEFNPEDFDNGDSDAADDSATDDDANDESSDDDSGATETTDEDDSDQNDG